jgi:alpha-1,2-mannosyltransferase
VDNAFRSPMPARSRHDTVAPVKRIYGVLAVEVMLIVCFAVAYDSLDFKIYLWGGDAIARDAHLYLAQGYAHWFTYTPFAALAFSFLAAMPTVLARVLWQLASVAALGIACALALKLAGRRLVPIEVATLVAGFLLLEPVYHTLYQGQINLILMAMALMDVWLVSRGRRAGFGIGVAAAIKLTPAIFVVFLLATRRPAAIRAACVATGTFLACALIGLLVAPQASRLYWTRLFHDTSRVGVPYISNQSPYGAAARILDGVANIGVWFPVLTIAIGVAGLLMAAVLARRGDWLAAAATTGTTGLLVSPISWAHHWVWVVPALVVLLRDGRWIAAAAGFVLFGLAPMWWTPHFGGPDEYGLHGWVTVVANCYLLAGSAFLVYMGWCTRYASTVARSFGTLATMSAHSPSDT